MNTIMCYHILVVKTSFKRFVYKILDWIIYLSIPSMIEWSWRSIGITKNKQDIIKEDNYFSIWLHNLDCKDKRFDLRYYGLIKYLETQKAFAIGVY